MRILILGGGGMLGHKIFHILSEMFEVYATFRDSHGMEYPVYRGVSQNNLIKNVNAVELDSVVHALAIARPDVVINCIGIIKQLKEVQDPIPAITLNALFPHRVAELCRAVGARLIHISTDCVFSGRMGNYREQDAGDAEDLYGRTKLLGEIKGDNCLTLRTSIIGRDFGKDKGLVEWFLSNQGGTVRGFTRAIYSGLTTTALSRLIGRLIIDFPNLSGLFHVSSQPISKHDLLALMRQVMNLDIHIEPDSSLQCDRSLDSQVFRSCTGYCVPSWNEMINELSNESTTYDEWKQDKAIS